MDTIQKFQNIITCEEELRSLLGHPSDLVMRKSIPYLDEHCQQFIAKSPFLFLATSNTEGLCDASPRGDGPGFVRVLDEKHLLIPDRPGNRRLDSMRNIINNPHVGLLFMIPGLEETLRINGQACLVRDERLLKEMAVKDRIPLLAIAVEVEECFVHCAKAFKRSGLWNQESWPSKEGLPSPAQMLADHARLADVTVKEVEDLLRESYTKRLY